MKSRKSHSIWSANCLLIAFVILLAHCSKKSDPQPLAAPVVTSFSPESGIEGTIVTITGKNFDPSADIELKFNNSSAPIIEVTSTTLTAKVPHGATTGMISVTINELLATSANDFTVKPSIVLSADSGAIGKSITIIARGFSFDSTPANNVVDFNGALATVYDASPTQLAMLVPYGATTGAIHISVNKNNAISSTNPFTIVSAWTQKAHMPLKHESGFAFAINDVGYFGGPYSTSFYKYNQVNDSWSRLNDLPEAFVNFGFAIGENAYGGNNEFYSYNAGSDQWKLKMSVTVPKITFYFSNFFTIKNKSYAVDPANGTWEFDPDAKNGEGNWSKLPASNNYPGGSSTVYQKTFVVGESAYTAGGKNGVSSNHLYKFTPGSGWTTLGTLPAPASGFIDMFSNGQYGYLLYGTNFWRYDPVNDSWLQLEDVTNKGFGNTNFNIGQKTYLIIGYNNDHDTREVWEYDPLK